MIPGYNHNVKYKERIFHVQTEDSGKQNPHIITLLYIGGNILESVKSSYKEQLTLPDIDAQLPNIMQKQHKGVLRGLISGAYDTRIEERGHNAAYLNGPAPLNVAEGSQHQTSFGLGGGGSPRPPAPKPAAAVAPPPVPVAAAPVPVAAKPASPPAPVAASDGKFASNAGSMLDALAAASETLDAEELLKALDSGDDRYVFGSSSDGKNLDDMMLDFFKGS